MPTHVPRAAAFRLPHPVPDQLRADGPGTFGNEHVSAHHVDPPAARGTTSPTPSCSTPSARRAARRPSPTGTRTSTVTAPPTHRLKPREPNLLRGLKEGGHHVTWPGMRGDTLAPDTTEPSVDEYGFGVSPAIRERLGIKDTAPEMWRGSV
ncbi:hypothetical protein ACFV90_37495 [Streptomyces sp. NPDC059904]|uniref:hypothetical protein n=1 Tax=Streptomyces sp. NPDC059904 TaxID=3346996 RepID=UPI0036609887